MNRHERHLYAKRWTVTGPAFRVACAGENHWVTRQPDGRLTFPDHEPGFELAALSAFALGAGGVCGCASVLLQWRRKVSGDTMWYEYLVAQEGPPGWLPDRMAAECKCERARAEFRRANRDGEDRCCWSIRQRAHWHKHVKPYLPKEAR